MKTRKRKRSAKAAPAVEPSVVDAVAAETLPVAEAVAAEPVVETVSETVAEVVSEPVSEVVEVAAEAVAEAVAELTDDSSVDPTAETVVAEPAQLVAAEPVEPVGVEAAQVEAGADPVVVLAANCSVKDAAALKTSLCAIASESGDVTLDVSAVERVDTATMQLLCAFVRDRIGRQQSVSWRGESQALKDAVRLLGVGSLLGLESQGVAA